MNDDARRRALIEQVTRRHRTASNSAEHRTLPSPNTPRTMPKSIRTDTPDTGLGIRVFCALILIAIAAVVHIVLGWLIGLWPAPLFSYIRIGVDIVAAVLAIVMLASRQDSNDAESVSVSAARVVPGQHRSKSKDHEYRDGHDQRISFSDFRSMKTRVVPVAFDQCFPVGTTRTYTYHTIEHGRVTSISDLNAYTCTCPRFHRECKQHAIGSPRRLCRHLMSYLAEIDGSKHPLYEAMNEHGPDWRPERVFELWVDDRQLCWFGTVPDGERFMRIYARTRRPSDKHAPGTGRGKAYSLSQTGHRFSYGSAPWGSQKIKVALCGLGVWKGGTLVP